jgi:arginyl-tRNA synthetase
LIEKEERALLKKLALFEDMLEASVQISSPHLLATHLMDISTAFHKFYDRHRVLEAAPGVREARFALLDATRTVVRVGLSLLGVSAPEKM